MKADALIVEDSARCGSRVFNTVPGAHCSVALDTATPIDLPGSFVGFAGCPLDATFSSGIDDGIWTFSAFSAAIAASRLALKASIALA